jgi:hypothetical protein
MNVGLIRPSVSETCYELREQELVKFREKFVVREGWKPFLLKTYDHISTHPHLSYTQLSAALGTRPNIEGNFNTIPEFFLSTPQ